MSSRILTVISVAILFLSGIQTQADSSSKTEKPIELELVTVTARHINENVLKLPWTVNSIDYTDIDNQHQQSLEDVLSQTPGVELISFGNAGQTSIKLRGVGALNKVSHDDTSVAIYQNGVPQPTYKTTIGLFDVQRVEILKGPQGTLYGRNSEAGIISLVVNKPQNRFEGRIGGEIGHQGHYQGEAVVNTPLTARLSARIALRYRIDDQHYTNKTTGEPVSRPNSQIARLSLRWKGEQDDVIFTAENNRQDDFVTAQTLLDGKNIVALPANKADSRARHNTLTLNWQHNWDDFYLHSVTNWGNFNTHQTNVTDGRYMVQVYGKPYHDQYNLDDNKHQWFQEIRLGSHENSPFFWVVGTNYYHSKRHFDFSDYQIENPINLGNPFNAELERNYSINNAAVFGEITYPVLENLDITTGLRYSHDKTDYKAIWIPNGSYPISGLNAQKDKQSIQENYLTGRIGLSIALTDHLRTYTTYSRGHKAGGFSDFDTGITSGEASAAYKPAKVKSIEIGIKADFPKYAIQANAAFFRNDVINDHVYVVIDPRVSFANTTENYNTRTQGLELGIDWNLNEMLRLRSNLTWVDAKITGKPKNSRSKRIEVGNRIPDTPKFSANLAMEHHYPVNLKQTMGNSNLINSIGYHYTGARANLPENNFDLAEHHQINARFGVSNERLDLYLYGTNLIGKSKELYGFYNYPVTQRFGGTGKDARVGAVGSKRSFGIGLRYHFL